MDILFAQECQLGFGFDPFGDDFDAQGGADPKDAAYDRLLYHVLVDITDQRHVQLDDVRLELGQQIQPRIACTEIVDGGFEALAFVLGNDAFEMILVDHLLVFGNFKNQPLHREVEALCRFQGSANAGRRLIHRVGQKIDADKAGDVQPGSQLHCLDAAGLVKLITIVGGDLGQNAGRAGSVGASYQRLAGKELAGTHIDDRLKRHAEVKVQRRTVDAGSTGRR